MSTSFAIVRFRRQMHDEALRLLPGSPRVQAWQALGFQGRLRELFSLLSVGAPSKEAAWDRTCSMMLGKSGYRPPWSATPHEAGAWNIAQVTQLLEQAEVIVLSPESHAAVMAAASTLEPADVNTLQRDRDFTALSGLLVLPEPMVTVNRGGSLSDIAAFGWQPITQHQTHPTAEHPAVQIVPLIDRDGPVQPDGWTAMLAQARAQKMPFPRLLPDGPYSLPLDGPMVKADEAQRAQFAEMRRTLHDALNAVATPTDPSDIGTWDGGRVDDSQDDFATRYMFAFWRLTAQGISSTGHPHSPARPSSATA
ncbi:hypothetical protein AB0942_09615 [Streptomyces nodosus]|uniref:hypothetical protein n=1 Tax=Streptomyces nodosus TaxID=40318 RepID=UPI0034558AB8